MNHSILSRIFGLDYYRLTNKEKKQIIKEQIMINLGRRKVLYSVLLIMNTVLLFIDIIKFRDMEENIESYRYLFYLHIIGIVGLSIFILFLSIKNKNNILKYLYRHKLFGNISVTLVLIWCVFLALNAQMIHGQISAYIIGAFCMASIFIIDPISNLTIYFISYIIFIKGMFMINVDPQQISGNIVNSSFLLILAIMVSNMGFSNFVNEYINVKTIEKINKKIKESNYLLEETVEKKTNELKEANKKIVAEIEKRHEIEIESLKNKLSYEKQKSLLDKKTEYEELRNEFFANISHELKTPLNIIYSTQQMINLYMKNGLIKDNTGKLNRHIKVMKQNCYRLIRLVGNLIDTTKIDTGNYKINLKNYDIVGLIKQIVYSVDDYISNEKINLVFNSDVKTKVIACDPDKIERIILNLLSNSVKFTPKQGDIYVNIYEKNNYICISVKDTGIGIPFEMQESIFERFIQVDKSTKRMTEGSGMGLSLVKSLVDMHSGKIGLKSEPNKGSEFIISLPNVTVDNSSGIKDDIILTPNGNVERINLEFSDIYMDLMK
ncbi:sensor histidine kinase [Dethiothermospora halolimnae]|uniref:sensor histidine kinase n=1 Tax=Dethiothermospora halolimnae TaxID=3114390 RepID=UPI003CCB7B0E